MRKLTVYDNSDAPAFDVDGAAGTVEGNSSHGTLPYVKLWTGTQSAYDALGVYDDDVLYGIE